MKVLKLYSTAALLLLLLVTTSSHGFVAAPSLNHSGMRNGENCGMQSSNGDSSQLGEISQMLHQAAWYQDRDNSMTAVSTEEGVGAAMATFWTLNGFTQGTQVCPGVYLATAHGVLDDPDKARRDGRALRSPSRNFNTAIGYPMSPANGMTVAGDASFVSPRLRDPSSWSNPNTDYVFVRVENPIRPNNYVRPVRASNRDLVQASNSQQIDIHMHRPRSRFNTNSNGTPDFNNQTWASDIQSIEPLYENPMRVNQSCDKTLVDGVWIGTDCPNEQAVSGSPETLSANGQDYLVGMHTRGDGRSYNNFEDDQIPNALLPSSQFCEDYESVCGTPCAELNEVVSVSPDNSVSL